MKKTSLASARTSCMVPACATILRTARICRSTTTSNLSVDRKFDLPTLGKVDVRVAAINVTDRVYELRDGSGIGVDAPPFGTRRGFYVGLQKDFSSNCLARGRQRSRVTPSQVSSRTHAWLMPTASRSRGFRRPFRTTLALLYRSMTIGHGRQHDVNVYILAGPHRKP